MNWQWKNKYVSNHHHNTHLISTMGTHRADTCTSLAGSSLLHQDMGWSESSNLESQFHRTVGQNTNHPLLVEGHCKWCYCSEIINIRDKYVIYIYISFCESLVPFPFKYSQGIIRLILILVIPIPRKMIMMLKRILINHPIKFPLLTESNPWTRCLSVNMFPIPFFHNVLPAWTRLPH